MSFSDCLSLTRTAESAGRTTGAPSWAFSSPPGCKKLFAPIRNSHPDGNWNLTLGIIACERHKRPHRQYPVRSLGKGALLNHKDTMNGFSFSVRRLVQSLVCAAAMAGGGAFAKPISIGHNWDQSERLQKGDLAGLERLRFLTSVDFPPFNYLDGGQKLSGFNIDLARAICAELQISNVCQIQALPWEDLQPSLKNGQGEAIIAGLAADIPARRSMAFSRPYLRPAARFAQTKANAKPLPFESGLEKSVIGVLAGTIHEKMLRSFFPKATIASYPSADEMRSQMRLGKVDAIFGDAVALSFWLSAAASDACCDFTGEAYYSQEFLGSGMRIAVKADDAFLEQSLNFALKAIQEKGVMDELYLKYFPVSFY